MKQISAVFRFEFLGFIKSGTFIGMTILMVAIALLGPIAPAAFHFFSEGGFGGDRTIAVVDPSDMTTLVDMNDFLSPRIVLFNNIEEARAAVGEGRYNYALELDAEGYTLYVTSMGLGIVNLQNQIDSLLRNIYRLEQFGEMGISHVRAGEILDFDPIGEIMTITPTGESAADTVYGLFANMAIFYVMSFMLYFGLLMGGQYLLTTVVREKSTKTMELLITSCKASHMLNGKVLGVGAAALAQILLMIGAALIGTYISGILLLLGGGLGDMGANGLDFTLQPDILFYMGVFFLLGFVMLSYVYAALASTVSRMEDASSISFLPTIIIMVGFIGGIIGMQNPGAGWVAIMSQIPLTAPFFMFMRICLGTAETWEILVSIGIQIATIALLSWLGSRIYRMGTLMYGNAPKVKDIVHALFSDGM